jgi:uncharacterized protein YndB with AHSA1/START domain
MRRAAWCSTLQRWLGLRAGWTLPVCEVDLRPGGASRWVWRGPDGTEMGVGGIYREVVRSERVIATEVWDRPWYAGKGQVKVEFTEQDGKATMTTTVLYETGKIRDSVLKTPMTAAWRRATTSWPSYWPRCGDARGRSGSAAVVRFMHTKGLRPATVSAGDCASPARFAGYAETQSLSLTKHCHAGRRRLMPNRLIEFRACYAALKEKPLPTYALDPFFDRPVIWQRIGRIIAEAANPSLKSRT